MEGGSLGMVTVMVAVAFFARLIGRLGRRIGLWMLLVEGRW